MKKFKKYTAALTAAAIALGLSSCGLDDLESFAETKNEERASESAAASAETDSSAKSSESTASSDSEPDAEPEEVKNYSWVIEPTLEADDIICPNNLFHAADSLGGYENSVILLDGKFSIIDRDGKLLSDEFADVYSMYESADEDFGLALYTTDYREVFSVNKTSGKSNTFEYVYNTEMGGITAEYSSGVPEDLDSAVLQSGQAAAVKLDSDGQYCIYSNGSADTSAVYSNYAQPMGGMPDGDYAIAVESNGKWGYYNSRGELIIACEYDADYCPTGAAYSYWAANPTESGAAAYDEPIPYLDSEGYIAVTKDGAAGYFDLSGNEIIEVGEFEAARPVYGGTAWVKQDGKWGLIKLDPVTQTADSQSDSSESEANNSESSADSTAPTSSGTDDSQIPIETETDNNSQTLEYAKIIDKCKEVCDTAPDDYNTFSRYYIYDIDGDGTAELITDLGSCEADRQANVYTYDGTAAVNLGSFVSWRSYFGAGDGVLYSEATAMGSYTLSTIKIEDGEIVIERGAATSESKLTDPLTGYTFDDLTGLELL